MKKLTKGILLIIALITIGCSKGEIDDIEKQSKVEVIKELNSTIIGGERRLASYGYEPSTDTPKDIAFQINNNSIIKTEPRNPVTSIQFSLIETKEDLEKEFTSKISVNAGGTIKKILKLDASFDQNVTSKLVLDSDHLHVIVRIKFASERAVLNGGNIPLTDNANNLLNNDFNEFIRQYGSFFVRDNTLGGESYYVYTHKFSKSDQFSRKEIKASVSADLAKIFNISGNVDVTEIQKLISQSTFENSFQISNVIGYSPRTIKSLEDFENEKQRFANYIITNPDKTTSIDLILESYAEVVDNGGDFFINLAKHELCFKHFEKWLNLAQGIKDILLELTDENLINEYFEALTFIGNEMNNSKKCNNSKRNTINKYYT